MRDVWYQALMAGTPRLMGRRLRPYSLAHRYTLRTIGSPYAFSGIAGDPAALLSAVSVCSRGVDDVRALLFGGDPWARDAAWAYLWRSLLSVRRVFDRCDAAFRQYLDDHNATPAMKAAKAGDGPSMQSPPEYAVARVLMAEYGMGESEAWDTQWARAICYCDVHAEANGAVEMMSPEWEHAMDLINDANAMQAGPEQEAKYNEAQAIFNAIAGRDLLKDVPHGG